MLNPSPLITLHLTEYRKNKYTYKVPLILLSAFLFLLIALYVLYDVIMFFSVSNGLFSPGLNIIKNGFK